MAINFGKNNRSVAFNPTSAFPLDARSYFESYEEAFAAARTAKEVGSTESVYYYGQILVVVEDNKATLYMIQPDNSLTVVLDDEESFELIIDDQVFVIDAETSELKLKGYDSASVGQVMVKGENGVTWQTPIDAYTKRETDEKIAAAAHLKRKIVKDYASIQEYIDQYDDAEQYIFMVPNHDSIFDDQYDEYMVITIADTKVIEKVGSWEVNLDDYAKKTELDTKVDKAENQRLITKEEVDKLASIEHGAEQNVIDSVSNDFSLGEDKKLTLNTLSINKISNLQDLLNSKVDSVEGWSLLSPTDQAKLNALVINGENVEISGTVNAENVQGLEDWINKNAGIITGLSENNLTDEYYNKLIESLFIKSVDVKELSVQNGQLKIDAISYDKVNGLSEALELKASTQSVETLKTNISILEQSINTYIQDSNARFTEIEDRLTWHSID